MRHVTPCKGKSPHNMLCFNAFALLWRKLHGTLYPGPSCLGKRQSRAAAVLRASAPSGAFRLDDAPSFNKKRNRQVGRLAMARMMTNKPKFRWAYARLLGFVLKESLRPCFVMQFKANCSLCYLLFTIFFIPLHGKNSFYSKNGKERFTIPSNRTTLRYCG